ncbi:transcription-repair coupling factor [Paracoccaceae bacterium]|nr:transcription-repair coupling factor [Paracoccaceae bacterium]
MKNKFIKNYNKEFQAFALSKVFENSDKLIHIHLFEREGELKQFSENIKFFNRQVEVIIFPAWDCLPYSSISPRKEIISMRYSALRASKREDKKRKIILLSLDSILQKIIPINEIFSKKVFLRTDQDMDLSSLIEWLEKMGYSRQANVYSVGEYAVRGGILDVYVPEMKYPVRLDFFGAKLEKIRTFDPSSQRSNGSIKDIRIFPVSEIILEEQTIDIFRQNYRKAIGTVQTSDRVYNSISEKILVEGIEHWLPLFSPNLEPIFSVLSGASLSYDHDLDFMIKKKWEQIIESRAFDLKTDRNNSNKLFLLEPKLHYLSPLDFAEAIRFYHIKKIDQIFTSELETSYTTTKDFSVERNKEDVSLFSEVIKYIRQRLKQRSIILSGHSEGSIKRLLSVLKEHELNVIRKIENFYEIDGYPKQIYYAVTQLDIGFSTPQFEIITEKAIFGGKLRSSRAAKRRNFTAVFEDLNSLNIEDLVVHIDYGIGEFRGLKNFEINGVNNDFLEINYAGSDKIFLPVENIELISPLGLSDAKLDKLGSANWQLRKATIKKKIKLIAEKLIKVAAERKLVNTQKVFVQNDLFQEFCNRFPYEETPDQLQAIKDVVADLSKGNPMDRLICGDVGFGKTEVAIRASFLMVTENRQVVLAAPTTLLAKQHYDIFEKRFDSYPIKIKMLSRLTSALDVNKIKDDLSNGDVNILIGTHSVINKNLKFNDLGLLIIDEEQSFGVGQKEQLKSLFPKVHILTLSATPIPRTLQMAFSGIRDLSLINTPPKNRMPIETNVIEFDQGTIRSAIMREIKRDGQVFFVVPRIKDIRAIENFLNDVLPEVKYMVATGKTNNRELEKTISAFYYGEFDLLVSTNIIGSGLDVQRANTIIIYKAELFGLSQLYQIRGRVGRSNKRAFAYLVTKGNATLTETAKKRLDLIKELNSLVSGFTLSSQDLEMRGSGNILGEEQTGQVNEVGVSLYQEMLQKTINSLKLNKNEGDNSYLEENWSPVIRIPTTARIPESYIKDSGLRLSFYRRLSNFENQVQLESLLAELIDRFGKLPKEIINLANILKIKEKCKYLQIELLEVGTKGITIKFREGKVENVTGLLAFIESDKGNIKPTNEKLFIKIKKGDPLISSYSLLKNIEKFIKKKTPSSEGASY